MLDYQQTVLEERGPRHLPLLLGEACFNSFLSCLPLHVPFEFGILYYQKLINENKKNMSVRLWIYTLLMSMWYSETDRSSIQAVTTTCVEPGWISQSAFPTSAKCFGCFCSHKLRTAFRHCICKASSLPCFKNLFILTTIILRILVRSILRLRHNLGLQRNPQSSNGGHKGVNHVNTRKWYYL